MLSVFFGTPSNTHCYTPRYCPLNWDGYDMIRYLPHMIWIQHKTRQPWWQISGSIQDEEGLDPWWKIMNGYGNVGRIVLTLSWNNQGWQGDRGAGGGGVCDYYGGGGSIIVPGIVGNSHQEHQPGIILYIWGWGGGVTQETVIDIGKIEE